MRSRRIVTSLAKHLVSARRDALEETARQKRLERLTFWSMIGTLAQGSFAIAAFVLSAVALWIAANYRSDSVAPLLEAYIDKSTFDIGFENHGVGSALIKRIKVTDGETKLEKGSNTASFAEVEAFNRESVNFGRSMASLALSKVPHAKIYLGARFPMPGDAIAPNGRFTIIRVEKDQRDRFLASLSDDEVRSQFITDYGIRTVDLVDLEVCYCSILGDGCRISHFVPTSADGPVRTCSSP